MKKKITEQDSVLFAEFMGWKYYDDIECYETPHIICKADDLYDANIEDWTSVIKPEDMEFSFSWDWLMPVVEKIEKESFNIFGEYEDVIINGCSCLIQIKDNEISFIETAKIKATYKAVIEFIKWYNKLEDANWDLNAINDGTQKKHRI